MDYPQQADFLLSYGRHSVLFGFLILVCGLVALRQDAGAPAFDRVLFAMLIITLARILEYDPKYLHYIFDEGKKFAWNERIHLVLAILGPAIFVVRAVWMCLSGGRSLARHAWLPLVLSVALLLAANRIAAYQRKRGYTVRLDIRCALLDLLVLTLAYRAGMSVVLLSVLIGIVAHLALVTEEQRSRQYRWVYLVAVLAFTAAVVHRSPAQVSGFALLLVATASLGTMSLVFMSRERTQANVEETLQELATFTGESQETVRELLQTSNRILADNWNRSQPKHDDSEALAQWYRDNSLYYLYAVSSFHLLYKQIALTLDVLRLARGRCLDYGAGNGELAVALARRGHATTYFDVEGKTREFAEWRASRDGLQMAFASARNQLGKNGVAYDTVIALDVLEHMPDMPGELEFLSALLAPGGKLIVSAPVGATKSHPMHLEHHLGGASYLKKLGLRNAKDFTFRWTSSEDMRHPDVFVFERPMTAADASGAVQGGSSTKAAGKITRIE